MLINTDDRMNSLDIHGFRQILDYFDRPWRGYRKVRRGVMRKIRKQMRAMRCSSVAEFLDTLSHNPKARQVCEDHLHITISRFFRDKMVWKNLRECVLSLFDRVGGEKMLVWSAGCASGEEVYSMAILWDQLNEPVNLEIWATDAREICLRRAVSARYPPSSLKEMSTETVASYFTRCQENNNQLQLSAQLSAEIHWQRRDLFAGPPRCGFHIIFIRNSLFTYYGSAQCARILADITSALQPGGYLIIGSHESLPVLTGVPPYVRRYPCIYEKCLSTC